MADLFGIGVRISRSSLVPNRKRSRRWKRRVVAITRNTLPVLESVIISLESMTRPPQW